MYYVQILPDQHLVDILGRFINLQIGVWANISSHTNLIDAKSQVVSYKANQYANYQFQIVDKDGNIQN